MTHTVIVGSGFASCTAIKSLRKQGYSDQITVVSPKAELFYYPSLIWVPAGKRNESDLTVDLNGFFRKYDVSFKAASASGLDPDAKVLKTDDGDVSFDYLIIGSGGRYIRKLKGIENAHIACAGWGPTKAFSDRLSELDGGTISFGFAGNPKEPSAMRGGPIFEFLFGTDTLLRQQGRRGKFKLMFYSPAPKPGARMGEKAVERLLAEMARRDIDTHLGNKMKSFEADKVVTEGGEFETDLNMFMPGMTGPAWAVDSGLTLSEGGFFKADAQCRVEGSECIYVAGDAGSFPGPDWKPKQAHMADLQAEAAVKNLLAHKSGQPQTHTFKTELICIIDSLTTGTMVYRDEKRSVQFGMPPFHWAKTGFEWNYLREYRKAV